jgi:hypothetical protein
VSLNGAIFLPVASLVALLIARAWQGIGHQHDDEGWLALGTLVGAAFTWLLPVRPLVRLLVGLLFFPTMFVALILTHQLYYCGPSISCR